MTQARPFVCVTVYGHFPVALECLQSVMAFTPGDVDVLVIDDFSPSPFVQYVPREITQDPRIHFHRNDVNLGYVRSANIALRWREGSDVVLVNSDILVSVGWLERLKDAAYSADHVATASVLTNEGSILTVRLDRSVPSAASAADLLELNKRLAELPPIVAPEIPVAVGHCLYVRAEAIAMVGVFDEAFGAGYEEEADFSLRCTAVGMRHVVAPDVYVLHRGGVSFGSRAAGLRKRSHRLMLDRYPGYEELVSQQIDGADNLRTLFLRVLLASRQKLRLLIDEEAFGPSDTDRKLVVDLTRTLSTVPSVEVTVALKAPHETSGELPDDIEIVSKSKLPGYVSRSGRFDCILSGQVSGTSELKSLWRWAHRVALLRGDYAAFENSAYHATPDRFFEYRYLSVLSALTADGTLGFSQYVLDQRPALGVPAIGTAAVLGGGAPEGPAIAMDDRKRNLVLVLGRSHRHENRLYALRLLARLATTGTDFEATFVGPEPPMGSSRPDEELFVREHPELAGRIEFHDWLPEDAIATLWARAAVLLGPSLHDGLGMAPFEASAHGVASLFGRRMGLAEVFPDVPYSLGFRSTTEDVEILRTLLTDRRARAGQIEYVRNRANALTWEGVAGRLVARAWEVCTSPPRIPSDVRLRLQTMPRPRAGLLVRLRRGPIGRRLLPVGSKRAATIANRVPRRFWSP